MKEDLYRAFSGPRHERPYAWRFRYGAEDMASGQRVQDRVDPVMARLARLATLMHAAGSAMGGDRSAIPSGYTYLAQLMMHDLVHTSGFASACPHAPAGAVNHEMPRLNLSSIYGDGPSGSPLLYESEGAPGRLKLGRMNASRQPHSYEPGEPADLPRVQPDAGSRCPVDGAALHDVIAADTRNADSVILSQLAALFMRLHNGVHGKLLAAGAGDPYRSARHFTESAFRSIIRRDLLPRLAGAAAIDRHADSAHATPDDWNVPAEAAFAIFRFGHSMVRARYNLNDRLSEGEAAPRIQEMLKFFDASDGEALPPTAIWQIDWSRFFDTGRRPLRQVNMATPIRPAIAEGLSRLRVREGDEPLHAGESVFSLPFRTLARGHQAGMPSGQTVARELGKSIGLPVPVLAPQAIKAAFDRLLDAAAYPFVHIGFPTGDDIDELARSTPLFLYTLLEAWLLEGGDRLGPVGSDFLCHSIANSIGADAAPYQGAVMAGESLPVPQSMPEMIALVLRLETQPQQKGLNHARA